MPMTSELSRRALVAATSASAAAPTAGESGATVLLVGIALAPSTEAARAEIVLLVQGFVSRSLEDIVHSVPPDLVAVTLF